MPKIEETPTVTGEGLLSDAEMQKLILAICAGKGGASEGVVVRWMEWCQQVKLNAVILEAVLRDLMTVRWDGKKFVFRKV